MMKSRQMGRPGNKAIKEVIILHHATIGTGGQVSLGSKIIKVHDYQYKGCQSTGPVQWSSPITSALYCLPAELAYPMTLSTWHCHKIIMLLHVLLANCGIKVYSG